MLCENGSGLNKLVMKWRTQRMEAVRTDSIDVVASTTEHRVHRKR